MLHLSRLVRRILLAAMCAALLLSPASECFGSRHDSFVKVETQNAFQFFVSFQLNRITTDLLQNPGVGASPYNPDEAGSFSAPPTDL